jgi:transcriptional regulator with XRE-family HTH domain
MRIRLREIREARGLSQRQLASLAGISHAAISRLETQDAATLMKLEKVAKVLGVTLADFFYERSSAEADLDHAISRLTDQQREAVLDLVRALGSQSPGT